MPATIAITGRFDDQTLALLDEQIALFEAENPDIQVAVFGASRVASRRHDSFAEKLGQADASLDIYVLDPSWLAEFDANQWLVHLDKYARRHQVDLEGFVPAALQANRLAGNLVAMPWMVDGGLLYYRRDLLDQHSRQPPGTWAELSQAALEIQSQEHLPYGLVWQGEANESLTCNSLEFIWAYGGDLLDEDGSAIFDSAQTRAGLQHMTDLVATGISPPDVASYNEATALADFQRGDAVFMRNWAYAWDRLNSSDSPVAGQVGLAPLPASCLGGQSLAISAHSHHPEQAFRFVAFLIDHQQQLQLARQGVQPPALVKVYRDPELLAEKPVLQDLDTALSTTRPRPQSPAYLALSEAIFTEVNRMLQAEQDAATTAAIIQHRLEAILR